MLEESEDDEGYSIFNSYHPSVGYKSRGDEGVHEGDVIGFARFTPSKATFEDDYVVLGLMRLLHTANFTVWPVS